MKPSVLVVDDDNDVRTIFKRRLENDGFRVMVAANRAELTRAIQDELPHVIILDVALPGGINGLDVCKDLKADSRTHRIPIFFVSGEFLSDKEKLSGLELGAIDYLRKPINLDELSAKIGSCVTTLNLGMSTTAPKKGASGMAASSKGSVLVIEDDPGQSGLIKEILSNSNYVVTCAQSGQEGVELAKSINPNLILLDLKLPDLNGVDVHSMLQEDDKTQRIPIVIMTGLDDSSKIIKSAAEKWGTSTFLPKPFGQKELLRQVRQSLSKNGRRPPAKKVPLSTQKESDHILERGPIKLHTLEKRGWFDGRLIDDLGRKQFGVLRSLVRHKGVVNWKQLLKENWKDNTNRKTLEMVIHRLRGITLYRGKQLIVTIGDGYKLDV